MPRVLKRRPIGNKLQQQRHQDPSQLSLDPWLGSGIEALDILDEDGPALLSAVSDLDTKIIHYQEALASSQDTILGILLEPNQVSPDIGCDICLQIEVEDIDRTPSAVAQVVPNDQA